MKKERKFNGGSKPSKIFSWQEELGKSPIWEKCPKSFFFQDVRILNAYSKVPQKSKVATSKSASTSASPVLQPFPPPTPPPSLTAALTSNSRPFISKEKVRETLLVLVQSWVTIRNEGGNESITVTPKAIIAT
ncbi:hypothetical protein CUMW_239940 [Citrus unshiu]|uniref:Uncharacterized protein n=1 Tax=Citrus unshiu TaxID=55188 RepID=A0A2H5QKZ4_CITUN|nr:hypothetical protein CUMW_239940 [Citrus unshiu]